MDKLHYLAYGSNLHPLRLQARLPSAKLVGITALHGYALKFHKLGQCLSGKCNLIRTRDEGDVAYAAVFEIAAKEKPILDHYEGPGYRTDQFDLIIDNRPVQSFAYIAEPTHIDEAIKPYEWYKSLVHAGARYHQFPNQYLSTIECVEAIPDEDIDRHHFHMQLLDEIRKTL